MELCLDIKNLSFGYTKDLLLFDNFNLKLKKGELKAIVGQSGSGKSTLFELILGNLKPLGGEIKRGSITQVFQDPYTSFHPSYSILNQIEDVTSLDNIDQYLRLLNIEYDLLLQLPHKLSGGQLQRASILRALLMPRELLLLDEPTSALDNITQFEVMKMLLSELESKAMLIITHDIDLAKWCANEIIELKYFSS